jgi:membrane protease YdiL (CAAX protease family)
MTRAAALYLLVAASAWRFNHGAPWMGSVFVVSSLGLPWTGRERGALRAALAWPRRGWGIALPLAALYLLVGAWRTPWAAVRADRVAVQCILALAEEFFFRAYLQEGVGQTQWGTRGWGPLTGKNLFAAALFGLAHALYHVPSAPLIACGGLALGWLVERAEGSIWPAVALHAASNIALALV